MKNIFNELFDLQEQVSSKFWSMSKQGKIDLTVKSEFFILYSKHKKDYENFKEKLINSDESNFIHLAYGNVYTTRPFIINEQQSSIYLTKEHKTIYRNLYG